jgi:Ca2+:H+ antiporter
MWMAATRSHLTHWTVVVPVLAVVALVVSWGRELPTWAVVVVAACLAGAVLAAVHHAEVVAARVGEPFGSLGALRRRIAVFNREGTGGALATVATLATLSLVLPTFTTSAAGPEFSSGQLAFAAVASLALYGLFVAVQTVRHRDYFLPITSAGEVVDAEEHADPPTARTAWLSLALLLVTLVAVVGDAKAVSPAIEGGVAAAGFPQSFVGVVIALLVLLPETLAAVRAARRDRVQTSLNLAYGSAMASIGLTIPAIAIASIWLDGPLLLGLGPTQIVLLGLTMLVSILTVVPGRATPLQGGVHLSLLAAFIFLAISP